MKRINQILIYSILVIITFSSCNKHDEKALLASVNEQIMGRYKCKSITFLGDPIDIDNDGNTSTNIINEFSKYDYTREIINTPLRIAPVGNYDYSMLINMEIPIQNIDSIKNRINILLKITARRVHLSVSHIQSGKTVYCHFPYTKIKK